jgi:hypothetical protein
LIAEFAQCPPGKGPDGKDISTSWRKLNYDFALARLGQ